MREGAAAEPARCTLVVVPRERFSLAERALATLYARTDLAFDLVYVDAGSPPPVRCHLAEQAARRGFTLIRSDDYLCPNAARNRGARSAHGEFLVFLDNDVLVAPGWLASLVACADRTGAGAVAPLYMIGEGAEERVHVGGGYVTLGPEPSRRSLVEISGFANYRYAHARRRLRPGPCDFAELHCLFVRREVYERCGPFDEGLPSMSEHLDFSLRVTRAGGRIFFEPRARVSYVVAPTGMTLSDLPYYRVRWSEEWNQRSAATLAANWDLDPASPFFTRGLAWARAHRRVVGLPERSGPDRPLEGPGLARDGRALDRQLAALGFDDEACGAVRRAYALACALHPRAAPLVARAAGAASVLAAYDAPVALVVAGLLHAAYTDGAVAGRRLRPGRLARWNLRKALGAEVEAIVLACARRAAAGWPAVRGDDQDRLPLADAKAIAIETAAVVADVEAGACTAEDAGRRLAAGAEVVTRLGFGALLAAARGPRASLSAAAPSAYGDGEPSDPPAGPRIVAALVLRNLGRAVGGTARGLLWRVGLGTRRRSTASRAGGASGHRAAAPAVAGGGEGVAPPAC